MVKTFIKKLTYRSSTRYTRIIYLQLWKSFVKLKHFRILTLLDTYTWPSTFYQTLSNCITSDFRQRRFKVLQCDLPSRHFIIKSSKSVSSCSDVEKSTRCPDCVIQACHTFASLTRICSTDESAHIRLLILLIEAKLSRF